MVAFLASVEPSVASVCVFCPRSKRQVSAVADGPRDALHHAHYAVHRGGRLV